MKNYSLIQLFLLFCILLSSPLFAFEPTQQTQGIFATQGNCNEIDLAFVPGNGSRRIVIGSANSNVSSFPQDFTGYFSGSLFGTGSNLGNSNYVVYAGSGSSVTVTGLTGGTQYYFAVFEYNGTGNNANYLLTNYPEADAIATGISMSVSSTTGSMCLGDSVKLTASGAATYQWSPSNTLSSSTDSVVWAKPTNTTTYTVTGYDTAGCSDNLSLPITVYNPPSVSLGSFSNRCINAGTLTLNSGNPTGGIYSGPGVTGNLFNPNVAGVGTHIITYTYSDIHGCTNFDTSAIKVNSKPNSSFPSLTDVCIDHQPFSFTTGSPSGGIYSGTGVTGGALFSPSTAGIGYHPIKYIYTNTNGCSDTSQSTQQVRALPVVTFASLGPLCISTTQYSLIEGTPAGGIYSGPGISGTTFSPQVTGSGTFILTYTYSDSHGCTNEDTSAIKVNTLPSVSLPAISSVCANSGPVNLNAGTPAGGTYTGAFVSGHAFYTGIAGAGSHTINYSYTDSNNCSNSATQTITVYQIPFPTLGSDVTACEDQHVTLNPGTFTAYTWSTGAHTQTITVDTTHRGIGTFTFIVTVANQNSCLNRDTVLVTFDPCSGIEAVDKNSFVIYPNPSSYDFTFSSEVKSDIIVYDMNGSEVFSGESGNSSYKFGEHFPAGSYILQIKNGGKKIYKLLVKQ